MSIPTTFNPLGTGGNSISFIRYPEYNRFDIAVSSGGVYEKLSEKLPIYTVGSSSWDLVPTENSTNPVTSDGIYNFVEELRNNVALRGENNTFTQTNTFNGAVALNGTTTKPASAEVWTTNTIMTLGMHQVAAWWDELEADFVFNMGKSELNANALLTVNQATNAVQARGIGREYMTGAGVIANTNLKVSRLVAGRVTLNPRAQVKIAAAGTPYVGDAGFESNERPWLWVTWRPNVGIRDINLIGAYAAKNSCPLVLVCDSRIAAGGASVQTRIVDAFLCSAPARGNAGGKADTVSLVLVNAASGVTDIHIGFKGGTNGDKRLMRHYSLPAFGFGEIGALGTTSLLPGLVGSRGNLAAEGNVSIVADMWAYQGTYIPSDAPGSAAFFVRDSQASLPDNYEGYSGVTYDKVLQQTVNVYLAEVQEEQPSTDPAGDYTFSDTPHDNKDAVEVPAAGGYVLARMDWYWGPGTIRYMSYQALAQAVVMDSWLADTEAGAEADGMVMGQPAHGYGTWVLSKSVMDSVDGWGGAHSCYVYLKVPPNTTGAERDGYAVVGFTGMRASILHIVQAAE